MFQEEISRATVERLCVERAGVTDPEYAAALDDQIRIHSELAGLSDDDLAAIELAGPVPKLNADLLPLGKAPTAKPGA